MINQDEVLAKVGTGLDKIKILVSQDGSQRDILNAIDNLRDEIPVTVGHETVVPAHQKTSQTEAKMATSHR